jgi:hypothetical protein
MMIIGRVLPLPVDANRAAAMFTIIIVPFAGFRFPAFIADCGWPGSLPVDPHDSAAEFAVPFIPRCFLLVYALLADGRRTIPIIVYAN